jgi:hypothetical protein
MKPDGIAESLDRCFISPNVADSNLEPANLVDVMDRAAYSMKRIADAIMPHDTLPHQTPDGGNVDSLTEAVIYAAQGLGKIADAISDLAEAVRDRED